MLNNRNNPTDKVRLNIGGMLLAVFGFLAVAYYGTVALSTRDPIWFSHNFSGQPVRMVIYNNGQRTELTPEQTSFAGLAAAVQDSLAQGVSHASGIGFSAGSLEDAYSSYLTLEVFFAQPVKLHATFGTSEPDQMLFPISGRHSEQPLVLLGLKGQYLVNAPVLKTIEPIRAALRLLGYPA